MTMKPAHKIDTYKEGWQRVEFCTVCGAEGLDLLEDCQPPVKKDDVQLELFVDKSVERS